MPPIIFLDGPVTVTPSASRVTVTTKEPFTPLPSVAAAVMVAEPTATPVTTPLASTLAILVLVLDQVTPWAASSGVIVEVSLSVLSASFKSITLDSLSDSTVTFAAAGDTSISYAPAAPLPSAAVAVMVTFSGCSTALAVTTPLVLTVATSALSVVHVTVLLVVFVGVTVAVSVIVLPPIIFLDGPVTVTPSASRVTVTTKVFFVPVPSLAVAVMFAEPTAAPVTVQERPSAVILAIFVSELFHVTAWAASCGSVFAVSNSVFSSLLRSINPALDSTPSTSSRICAVAGSTVTAKVSVTRLPSFAAAVIPATPGAIPVTTPLLETVATAGSLEDQVTALLVACEGVTAAVQFSVKPTTAFGLPALTVMLSTSVATVTLQVAFSPLPSVAVAVMVAEPAFRPVTVHLRPLAEILATVELVVVHLTPACASGAKPPSTASKSSVWLTPALSGMIAVRRGSLSSSSEAMIVTLSTAFAALPIGPALAASGSGSPCPSGCSLGCSTGCSLGCSLGCSTGCSLGCSLGCSTGCSLGCSVGCSPGCSPGCSSSGSDGSGLSLSAPLGASVDSTCGGSDGFGSDGAGSLGSSPAEPGALS